MTRVERILQHRIQSEAVLREVLDRITGTCPEILSPSDKNRAHGYISDLISDLFADAIRAAEDDPTMDKYHAELRQDQKREDAA